MHDAFGREREAPLRALGDGSVVVESADAIPLDPSRLDVLQASSRGLGELIAAVGGCPRLLVCLGGTATMDGGAGLLEVLAELPAPTTVLCDTRATLLEAPRAFGPQKGATQATSPSSRSDSGGSLTRALGSLPERAPRVGSVPRSPRSGQRSSRARSTCSRRSAFATARRPPTSSSPGKARSTGRPSRARLRGRRVRACRELGVRCVLFGGRVEDGIEAHALSGDPARAREDLEELALGLGGLGLA